MRDRVSRSWIAVAAVVFMSAALISCTVRSYGLTGATIDESGRLTAVLGWCPGHPPDTLVLYTDAPRGASRPEVTVATLRADGRPAGTYAELPLSAPPPGWDSDISLPPDLDSWRTYHMYGATQKNVSSTAHVDFTVAALRRLPRGTIHMSGLYDEKKDDFIAMDVGKAEFQRQVRLRYKC